MPWVRAMLRGQRVYARAGETGALVVENGRVEVRYKPNDGRRYDARADNLTDLDSTVLPEETCGAAQPVAKRTDNGRGANAQATNMPIGTSESTEQASLPTHAQDSSEVVVYADGACSGNPGPAGLGVVILDGAQRIELSEFLGDRGTNNIAELTAILRALKKIPDPSRKIVIHTDSQYSIGVLQKGWKAKANKELVAELREELKKRPRTRLKYVPGHAGVVLNERADALARDAIRTRTITCNVFQSPTLAQQEASK